MRLINHTNTPRFSRLAGTTLLPGARSADGKAQRGLSDALEAVIKGCGNSFYVVLNPHELDLLSALASLDKSGVAFDPSKDLDAAALTDPYGEARNEDKAAAAHAQILKRADKANAISAKNEEMVNGEVGPATPEQGTRYVKPTEGNGNHGRPVTPADVGHLESSLAALQRQNAAIASGAVTTAQALGIHTEPVVTATQPTATTDVQTPPEAQQNTQNPVQKPEEKPADTPLGDRPNRKHKGRHGKSGETEAVNA